MVVQNLRPFAGHDQRGFFFAGGSPAALLIHGFFGTPAEMRPLGTLLNQAGWTVKGILLPGFGPDLETLHRRSAEMWVDAVQTVLDQLSKDHAPVVLMGNSMGGAIAIDAAAARPVDALILLAPFWSLGGLLWPLFRLVIRRYFPFQRADFRSPEVRRALTRAFGQLNLDDADVQRSLRGISIPVRVLDELRHVGSRAYRLSRVIGVPKLVLQGSHDNVVLPAKTRKLVRRFPGPTDYREVNGGHDLVEPDGAAWRWVSVYVLDFARTMLSSSQ